MTEGQAIPGMLSRLLPGEDLSELIAPHVAQQPERIAIGSSDLRVVLSYRHLDRLVRSAATQLSGLGVGRGDTVALIAENSVDFAVGFLTILSIGARAMPLNPTLTAPELDQRISAVTGAAVLLSKHQAEQRERYVRHSGDTLYGVIGVDGSAQDSSVHISKIAGIPHTSVAETVGQGGHGDAAALVLFTAGSSGAPKAVPLTHGNVIESIRGICAVYELSRSDSTLIVMPLFHGHGLIAGLLATLASGGGAYLPSSGEFSAHSFWPDMARIGASWYTAVPTIHRILINRAGQDYPSDSPVRLRFIRSCSEPLTAELAAETTAAFRAPMIGAYGMTETSHQTSSNPLPTQGRNISSTVGKPTGVEVRIAAEDGKEAAAGSIGEIWVRGATVTAGYLNNPDANSASFVGGWFRSGDLGSKDADGYISIKGRIKDIINRGGEKISPNDIDTALLSNPKVLEAASFGEADAIHGEDVHAAVILRPGMDATERELQDATRSMLSRFEVPVHIHIMADFPRTSKGSVDRGALAARFSSRKASSP